MCGVAGFCNISNRGFVIDELLIDRMQQRIEHRGPDGSGTWISEQHQLALANRRLAIIDTSAAGKQPMLDRQQSVVISFNGEIYNFRTLRKELEALGYEFFSHTDTETILYAYKEWGIYFLHKLEGMFAIVLFDIVKNELYLVRDRIGEKPLYFSVQGGILSFASEIKALWELPWNKKDISSQGLYHYLTFMVTPAPFTIFNQIYKLPAGFYLKLDAQRALHFKEWYTPLKNISAAEKKQFDDEQFCIENIRDLLIDSIQKRMVSDVPFGAFLSGGIDSSLNVALMSMFTDKVKTFTVAFSDGPEFDEIKWARLIAERYGTEHHEIIISEKEAFDFYAKMVYHLDEPLADCVCIPFYYVAKLAKDAGVSVVQVGEGADELFFGYNSYAQYKNFYDHIWHPTQKFVPAVMRNSLHNIGKLLFSKRLGHAEMLANWARQRGLFWSGAVAFNEYQKDKILDKKYFGDGMHDPIVTQIFADMRQEFDSFAIIDYHLSYMKSIDESNDFCKQMLYLELKHRLPELLLMRADKMSMAASVEARVPFLDHRLVEFMLHVPAHLKFKNNTTKYLLKKVAQGLIPDLVIQRQKVGFAAPTARWFTSGNYFPAYFKKMSNVGITPFADKAKNIENIFHTSKSSWAVQNWVLQNIWSLKNDLE